MVWRNFSLTRKFTEPRLPEGSKGGLTDAEVEGVEERERVRRVKDLADEILLAWVMAEPVKLPLDAPTPVARKRLQELAISAATMAELLMSEADDLIAEATPVRGEPKGKPKV